MEIKNIPEPIERPEKNEIESELNQSKQVRIPMNRFDFSENSISFSGGPLKRQGFKLALWMFFSLMIDTLLIGSISCLNTLVLAFLKQFFSPLNFLFFKINLPITLSVVLLFTGWVYYISTRVLRGASFGESACSLRVGQPNERLLASYPSKIIIRTSLQLLTGLVVLPVLSLLFKKDIPGLIVGARLYSLK